MWVGCLSVYWKYKQDVMFTCVWEMFVCCSIPAWIRQFSRRTGKSIASKQGCMAGCLVQQTRAARTHVAPTGAPIAKTAKEQLRLEFEACYM